MRYTVRRVLRLYAAVDLDPCSSLLRSRLVTSSTCCSCYQPTLLRILLFPLLLLSFAVLFTTQYLSAALSPWIGRAPLCGRFRLRHGRCCVRGCDMRCLEHYLRLVWSLHYRYSIGNAKHSVCECKRVCVRSCACMPLLARCVALRN